MMKSFLVLVSAFLLIQVTYPAEDDIVFKRRNHRALDLDQRQLSALSSAFTKDDFNDILDHILVPRVVGTKGHDMVRDYLITELQGLGWTVETDSFAARVPILGKVRFDNVIATLNPNAERFLVLAAHYDSKYFPDMEFLGATDSAVPCAQLIHLARAMKTVLEPNKQNADISLKFVFFDGEEAFKQWNANDSIYGARHLAKKWFDAGFLPRIDMLVLLDLIGAADPHFYSFFPQTETWYGRLIAAENKLGQQQLLSNRWQNFNQYFKPHSAAGAYIEDDHIPFMRRNVPILHLIPTPFPEVWHKAGDDRDVIDCHTTLDITKTLAVFVAEYLGLG